MIKPKEVTFMPFARIKWDFLTASPLSQLFLPQTSKPYLHSYKNLFTVNFTAILELPPPPPGLRHKAKLARCF